MSCFKAERPTTAAAAVPPALSSASSSSLQGDHQHQHLRGDAAGPATIGPEGIVPGAVPRVTNGDLPRVSIREALRGKAILITGATGYIGGVVLEQLLRVAGAQVGSVYVLSRSRGGRGSRERVGRVIGSGLFDMVRRQYPDTLRKLVVLDGDLSLPGLGLSEAALAEMAAEPSILVIHSAARIALDDPIQDTLRNNYESTQRLLELVERRLPRCAGFVHVSTSFVGMALPHNSCVPERLLPLMFGDQRVDHARLARELLAVDKIQADGRATLLCKNWNLPNTYLLGKHLSEALVEQYHAEGRIAGGAAIVRPSLVSAIAGAPYPGYVGNLAGPSGYMTAFALGFFNDNSAAWHAWHLLDSVPGDVAAGVTLAAAATLAAGIRSRGQLYALCSALPAPRHSLLATRAAAAVGADEGEAAAYFSEVQNEDSARDGDVRQQWPVGLAAAPGAAAAGFGSGNQLRSDDGGEMLVFHAATSTINPCMHFEAYEMAYRFFTVHKPKYRLGGYVKGPMDYTPVPWKVAVKKRITEAKVTMAAGLLSCFGEQKAARRLRTGFTAWSYANDVKHDKTLFFSIRNVLALERLLAPDELEVVPLVWRSSWIEYGNTYMAGVCRLFMGLPIPPSTPQLPHHFVYIPYVLIPEDQLPPLAGTRRVVPVAAPPAGPVPAVASAAAAAVRVPPQAAPAAMSEQNGERGDELQEREELRTAREARVAKAVQLQAPPGAGLPLKSWTGSPQVELAGVTTA